MDELELKRIMDGAIERTIRQMVESARPVPHLIQLCRVQSQAAERLEAMYRAGVISRYTMPAVVVDPPGSNHITIRSAFDYVEDA